MKIFNRKISVRILMTVLVITILLVSVAVIFAVSSNFAVPYTFTSGTTISSSEVNANFQAIGQTLPASKTISFGAKTLLINTENQNVSGLLTVTPPANGYLIVFGHATISLSPDSYASVYIVPTDSTGVPLSESSWNGYFLTAMTVYDLAYSKGYVTANTPLYFYLGANLHGTSGTIQGSLTALFIPAPNQLP